MELMSRVRRGLAKALLVVVVLWPGIHIGLTRQFEWNPWKFFGFAMYVWPSLSFETHIYDITTPSGDELIPLSPAEDAALESWMYRVAVQGPTLTPFSVAETVRQERPDFVAIRIEFSEYIFRPGIDRIGRRSYFWDMVGRDDGGFDVYLSRDDMWLGEIASP